MTLLISSLMLGGYLGAPSQSLAENLDDPMRWAALKPGHLWNYTLHVEQVTRVDNTESIGSHYELPATTQVLRKSRKIRNSRPVYEVLNTLTQQDGSTVKYVEFIAVGKKDLLLVGRSQGEFSRKTKPEPIDPAFRLLVFPLHDGMQWQAGTLSEIEWTARHAGFEDVTTPAGTFKDCLKIEYTSDHISPQPIQLTEYFSPVRTLWYAYGIGLVKQSLLHSFETEQTPENLQIIRYHSQTYELTDFKRRP